MKKFLLNFLIFTGVVLLVIWLVSLNAGPKADKIEYGVTFSKPYAQSLGLNWKEVYVAILDDLNVRKIRLSAYWNEVQGDADKYNFASSAVNAASSILLECCKNFCTKKP